MVAMGSKTRVRPDRMDTNLRVVRKDTMKRQSLLAHCVTLLHCTALLLCSASLFAQQDIYVNGKGPVLTIGTGLIWGSSGKGAVNNNYIFTPNQPQQNACMYVVNNNPTNSHSFTITIWQSGDPSIRSFSTGARYIQTQLYSGSVGASSTSSFFAHMDAAATATINVSGSSSQAGNPDTADIYVIQTTSEHCPTGSINQFPITATGSTTAACAGAGKCTILTGIANTRIYVTALHVNVASTITTTSNVSIGTGASGCAALTGTSWRFTPQLTAGTIATEIGNSTGIILKPTNIGQDLCIDASGLTGGSLDISVSYAQQ